VAKLKCRRLFVVSSGSGVDVMVSDLDKAKMYLNRSEKAIEGLVGMDGISNALKSIAESNIVIAELLYEMRK